MIMGDQPVYKFSQDRLLHFLTMSYDTEDSPMYLPNLSAFELVVVL